MGRARPSAAGTLACMLAGPIVWAVHLTLVYGGHTLLCTAFAAPGAVAPLILVVTAAAEVLLAALIAFPAAAARLFGLTADAPDGRDPILMARLLAMLSALAVLWGGATTLFLTACELSR